MKKRWIVLFLLSVIFVTGCLDFGDDLETIAPTPAQVSRCRSEMYLNPSIKIVPLGFKLQGSGIDDAIWFKFETSATELSQIFDSTVVDTTAFSSNASSLLNAKDIEWWDIQDKTLFGGQVELPNARFMNVGVEKTDHGNVVYILWHET